MEDTRSVIKVRESYVVTCVDRLLKWVYLECESTVCCLLLIQLVIQLYIHTTTYVKIYPSIVDLFVGLHFLTRYVFQPLLSR